MHSYVVSNNIFYLAIILVLDDLRLCSTILDDLRQGSTILDDLRQGSMT
jgi:hypothetical protein